MKWWRIIWAIYVLVLSGMPCEALCQDEPATEQATRSTSDEHDHDASCSPFCLCATCSGCTLPQAPHPIGSTVAVTFLIVAGLPVYQPPHTFDLPGRIWQPPRLG